MELDMFHYQSFFCQKNCLYGTINGQFDDKVKQLNGMVYVPFFKNILKIKRKECNLRNLPVFLKMSFCDRKKF